MAKMLKRSPHYGQHVAHGATNFFDFAGWEMPTHFSSMEKEAAACRNAAILFDGHAMGELHIKGKDALKAVQKLCVNDISKAKPGMFVYTSLCKEDGGIFDDLVVFCLAENHYLLTVAAFNTHKTPAWVEKHTAGMNVCVMDMSAGTTCIEIQGPKSRQIMQKIANFDCSNAALPYYRFVNGKIADIDVMVARMGVTGELGYEIFYDPGYAWQMYDAFVKAGEGEGMELCWKPHDRNVSSRESLSRLYARYRRNDQSIRGRPWLDRQARQRRFHRPCCTCEGQGKRPDTQACRLHCWRIASDGRTEIGDHSQWRAERPCHDCRFQPHVEKGNWSWLRQTVACQNW